MDKYVKEYKEEFRISHSTDDDTIERKLKESHQYLQGIIGKFEIDDFLQGKELVFSRVRYALNDSLEFFKDNFQQEIIDASIELLGGDTDAN